MNERDTNDITSYSLTSLDLLYSFIPVGCYKLRFEFSQEGSNCDEERDEVGSKSPIIMICEHGCLGQRCCRKSMELDWESLSASVEKKPYICCSWRILRDGINSFVFAFLFHLVPSVIWGPENALGSSANHQKMGVVWFGSWPVIFILLQYLRPQGIHFCGNTPRHGPRKKYFLPFPSKKYATDVKTWIETSKQLIQQDGNTTSTIPSLPKKSHWSNVPMIVGLTFLLFLIVNMFVTMKLVQDCTSRGCCKDNEDTLMSCRETGYPS